MYIHINKIINTYIIYKKYTIFYRFKINKYDHLLVITEIFLLQVPIYARFLNGVQFYFETFYNSNKNSFF